MSKTISISLSERDLAEIDNYCTMHELTRSKFFVQSAIEKVGFSHLVDSLILMNGYLDRIDRNESLDEKDRKLLREIAEYYAGGGDFAK